MFHDFINLLYPRFCQSCAGVLLKNEVVVCTSCLHELPIIHSLTDNENATRKVFYGRVNIQHATSLLLYEKKGKVQQLMHNLKYRRQEEIGGFLGKWLGRELVQTPGFNEISAVIPVPLHKTKLKKRGFNQTALFGKEIARALQVPYVDTVLVKKTSSSSQTLKTRLMRWGTIEETFLLENPHSLENSHILIVDDIVTTGATLEACSEKLLHIPGVKISIATMALTS